MKMKTILLSVMAAPLFVGGAIFAVSLAAPSVAEAQSSAKAIVDKAIQSGVIGETAAGYLALTGNSADTATVNAMNEINIGRKSVYTKTARAQGVSVEVVAALTGEKQLSKAPRGSKVLTSEGRWITVR